MQWDYYVTTAASHVAAATVEQAAAVAAENNRSCRAAAAATTTTTTTTTTTATTTATTKTTVTRCQVPGARSSTTNICCQDSHPQATITPEAKELFQADIDHSNNDIFASLCGNIFQPVHAPQTTAVLIQNHTQQTQRHIQRHNPHAYTAENPNTTHTAHYGIRHVHTHPSVFTVCIRSVDYFGIPSLYDRQQQLGDT